MTPNIYDEIEKIYDNLLASNKDPFEVIHKMQKENQKRFFTCNKGFDKDPERLETIGEKYDFIRDNKTALDDEFREVVDALPGISGTYKERSALWKKWMLAHESLRSKTFKDLSPAEILNIKQEYIDMMIFMINMSYALEVSPKELFILLYMKCQKNMQRLENKY